MGFTYNEWPSFARLDEIATFWPETFRNDKAHKPNIVVICFFLLPYYSTVDIKYSSSDEIKERYQVSFLMQHNRYWTIPPTTDYPVVVRVSTAVPC